MQKGNHRLELFPFPATSRMTVYERRGFTLIEMLVGVLAVLAAVLFPVFSHVREKARASACLSNYHQIGLAVHLYAQDNDDITPPDGDPRL